MFYVIYIIVIGLVIKSIFIGCDSIYDLALKIIIIIASTYIVFDKIKSDRLK